MVSSSFSPCDNFLYGFKGGLTPAIVRWAMWPEWQESRESAGRSAGSVS
jgi:hypothetical protein